MKTTYKIEKTDAGYIATDGVWESATYCARKWARLVALDAAWGERGHDGRGTYEHRRIS